MTPLRIWVYFASWNCWYIAFPSLWWRESWCYSSRRFWTTQCIANHEKLNTSSCSWYMPTSDGLSFLLVDRDGKAELDQDMLPLKFERKHVTINRAERYPKKKHPLFYVLPHNYLHVDAFLWNPWITSLNVVTHLLVGSVFLISITKQFILCLNVCVDIPLEMSELTTHEHSSHADHSCTIKATVYPLLSLPRKRSIIHISIPSTLFFFMESIAREVI